MCPVCFYLYPHCRVWHAGTISSRKKERKAGKGRWKEGMEGRGEVRRGGGRKEGKKGLVGEVFNTTQKKKGKKPELGDTVK